MISRGHKEPGSETYHTKLSEGREHTALHESEIHLVREIRLLIVSEDGQCILTSASSPGWH